MVLQLDALNRHGFNPGGESWGPGNGAAEKRAPAVVKCAIPPLPAGTYTADSQPAVTFTIPDAGIAACN